MKISNKSLTYDLLLGSRVSAWSNSNNQGKNFTKRRSIRHQSFGFGSLIVHCTLKRRAADA